jgi:hypothetical protein
MAGNPGLRDQTALRSFFRVGGALVLLVGLACTVAGMVSFFAATSSFEGPQHFWLCFVGLPLMAVGGWMLQAGFLGAAARYVAGESAPVVRDTAAYLSRGRGVLGIGRDEQDPATRSGPYCSKCGVRNDADARFCDACGNPLPAA